MRVAVTEKGNVRADLARTTLAVLSIVGLIAACFWILRPFVPALMWSTMIVVATWSLMLRVQTVLWNRRWLAVVVMVSALVLAFVIPFSLAIATIVENADEIASWARSISKAQLPGLPHWVPGVPIVGPRIAAVWSDVIASGPSALTSKIEPYAKAIASDNGVCTFYIARRIG